MEAPVQLSSLPSPKSGPDLNDGLSQSLQYTAGNLVKGCILPDQGAQRQECEVHR